MPRIKARFSITIKDLWTGKSWTVRLPQAERLGKFWPQYNGRRSKKHQSITTTVLSRLISRWINRQQEKLFFEYDREELRWR